jgi:hypothetical protein
MTLRDPESRKALRVVIGSILALALIALVWAYAGRLTVGLLALVLVLALSIIALRVMFDGAENVVNSVKFKIGGGGIEGSVTDDDDLDKGAGQ